MYWIALQTTVPVVVQFSLGGIPALVALLTAAVPAWLAARTHLISRRRPRLAPRLILVETVPEPTRHAA
jgi:hypothetical protein